MMKFRQVICLSLLVICCELKTAQINDQNTYSSLELKYALQKAIDHRSVEDLRRVLGLGADINSRLAEGKTALIIAAERGLSPLVSELLRKGADVTINDRAGHDVAYYINNNTLKNDVDLVALMQDKFRKTYQNELEATNVLQTTVLDSIVCDYAAPL